MILYPSHIFYILLQISIATTSFDLYANIREQVTILPYTGVQRVRIASSINNLFSIYVNRLSKIEYYKHEYPDIDPIPRAMKHAKQVYHMQDLDFHYKYIDIFKSLRDYHTQYLIPGPHGCISVQKSIKFSLIGSGETRKVIVSSRVMNQIITYLSPAADLIEIGDEIISFDGIPIFTYLKSLAFTTGGANPAGSLKAAVLSLMLICGRNSKLPISNSNIFELKSLKTSKKYFAALPWIAVIQNECFQESQKLIYSLRNPSKVIDFTDTLMNTTFEFKVTDFTPNPNTSALTPSTLTLTPSTPKPLTSSTAKTLKATALTSSTPGTLRSNFFSTSNPMISWTLYDPSSKNLGIIAIKTFEVLSGDTIRSVEMIRGLLLNELQNTSAILFDVRDNTGGKISFADTLPQLFSPDIKTGYFRSVVSEINRKILLNPKAGTIDQWGQAYLKVKDGDEFSPPAKLIENENANRIGQVYTRPVGVLTDGVCYSSCEIFAANMKDNNIAIIFGEDEQTGGGGANVVQYNKFLSQKIPEYYPPIPYVQELPLASQDLNVAWKQFIRIGGQLIEDVGVKSDYIIAPTLPDILPLSHSMTQFDRIADILIKQGITNGRHGTHFRVSPEFKSNINIGDPLFFTVSSRGFKRIAIYNESGFELMNKNIEGIMDSLVTFKLDTYMYQSSTLRFNIRGYDIDNKLAFSTCRQVKCHPDRRDYLKIAVSQRIDMRFYQKYVGSYGHSAKLGLGWKDFGGGIRIGDGSSYSNNIHTIKSYFLYAPTACTLYIQGSYDTSFGSDYIKIGYLKNFKFTHASAIRYQIGKGFSGRGIIDVRLKIPAGEIELAIEFSSRELNYIGTALISRIDVIE